MLFQNPLCSSNVTDVGSVISDGRRKNKNDAESGFLSIHGDTLYY